MKGRRRKARAGSYAAVLAFNKAWKEAYTAPGTAGEALDRAAVVLAEHIGRHFHHPAGPDGWGGDIPSYRRLLDLYGGRMLSRAAREIVGGPRKGVGNCPGYLRSTANRLGEDSPEFLTDSRAAVRAALAGDRDEAQA